MFPAFAFLFYALLSGCNGAVVILNNDNFYKDVQGTSTTFLVAFDDLGGVSEKILAEIDPKLESYGLKTGSVNCAKDAPNKKICLGAALRAVPTFHLYMGEPSVNPYTKKKNRPPVVFSGANSVRSLESFIGKQYRPFLPHVSSPVIYNHSCFYHDDLI